MTELVKDIGPTERDDDEESERPDDDDIEGREEVGEDGPDEGHGPLKAQRTPRREDE